MTDINDTIKAEGNLHAWEYSGHQCLMVRHPSLGHWCGYVGVPLRHPLYGKHYDSADLTVHGGLTWGDDHAPDSDIVGLWWFGFDCAHAGDLMPYRGMPDERAILGLYSAFAETANSPDVYRDAAYVREQTQQLADQLSAATGAKQ